MNSEKNKKIKKVVVDTNILISSLIFPGRVVVEIFDEIIDGQIMLGISEDIIREFIRVCVYKFEYDPEKTVKIAEIIRRISKIITPSKKFNVITDEADNRILECAVAFDADYIISGDKHLLKLKKYKNIKILSPYEFIKIID